MEQRGLERHVWPDAAELRRDPGRAGGRRIRFERRRRDQFLLPRVAAHRPARQGIERHLPRRLRRWGDDDSGAASACEPALPNGGVNTGARVYREAVWATLEVLLRSLRDELLLHRQREPDGSNGRSDLRRASGGPAGPAGPRDVLRHFLPLLQAQDNRVSYLPGFRRHGELQCYVTR